MKMLLCESGSWVLTTYFPNLAKLLVCRNGSLQGSQQVLSNDSLGLATQSVTASLF